MLDWFRLWPEFLRLNLQKARYRRRLRRAPGPSSPAPCQSDSDSGRAGLTRCEACHRVDRASRYRFVCPALRSVAGEWRCGVDAAEVRPYWGRAAAALLLPPLALVLLAALGVWALLLHQGLRGLSPLDVLLPARWETITARRRAHFHALALNALASDDPAAASIALFTAAQTGQGTPAENRTLARLATLGGYHSLADELHAATRAAHPEEAVADALAWHDDLLLAGRPARLASLALEQLALPAAPRDFWLRAFFESICQPGVAAPLLADPVLRLPHPGLRPALAARAALDRHDPGAARDPLLALAGLPPGPAVRRFLAFTWLEAGDPAHALAAAFDSSHPIAGNEPALLAYAIAQRSGHASAAREALRPLLALDEQRPALLAALVLDPDAELVAGLADALPAAARQEPRTLAALWLAARRAARPELAAPLAAGLARFGHPIPEALAAADFATPDPKAPGLAAALLPLDREILYALRAPAPSAAKAGPAPGHPATPQP